MASREAEIDLVAIGRCAIDLYGQQIGGRLEDMVSFAKYLGGSPANTVVGGARLGLKTALVTRVGADHMGRFLAEELAREGVDTRGVHSDPSRLTAMVMLGIRSADDFPMIFFREDCADMALDESDIDPALIASATTTLISGTHLSRPHSFAACMKAIWIAKDAGRRVAFDIDYRPVLWGLEARDMGENRYVESAETTDRLMQVVPHCDLVVGTEEEIMIMGGSSDLFTALRAIRSLCHGLIICKLGAQGCVAFPDVIPETLDGADLVGGFPVEVCNAVASGTRPAPSWCPAMVARRQCPIRRNSTM
jgi:5-dehydro-2-deoxygluconokinase